MKRLYERKSYESARILDIGCGRELPLAKLLYSSKLIPQRYIGVDAGPINDEDVEKIDKTGKFPNVLFERTNFLELKLEDLDPDGTAGSPANIVTCFEVLEHVEPEMMIQMLQHMRALTTHDARYFISTPCWNRTDCAANHVNEMLYEALGACFERQGFIVENVYGTFASIRDYEHLLSHNPLKGSVPMIGDIFDKLREYYDTNFLSCVFAPLFPAQSRNCLWELRKSPIMGGEEPPGGRKFPLIHSIEKPWSSSAKWEDMAK